MCGIAGVFGREDPATVRRMLAALRHRGPDDESIASGADFTLGARRLSIIDVVGGRQPLSDESAMVWAAQNGEIYNFRELSVELAAEGHRFRTRTDTEVLVHGYREWGAGLPEHLVGMFAFAVWDSRSRRGLLVRDRVGKKPLYTWEAGDGALWFASEIKALLTIPGFRREINPVALSHYLSYKHVPAPHSIFRGIRAFPPGHRLTAEIGPNGKLRVREDAYWRPSFKVMDGLPPTPEEAADALLAELRRAVRRRLVSDVPIGFLLSGGIDSGMVAVLAAEQSADPIQTFTLTYSSQETSEGKELDRAAARRIATQIGSQHHEEEIRMGDLREEFPRIISSFDEPFAGVISTYFLSRAMARYVKVALSGDGADELFGSYLSHRLAQPIDHFVRNGRSGGVEGFRPYENEIDYVSGLADREAWRWRSRLLVFTEEEKHNLLTEVNGVEPTPEHLRRYFEGTENHDPLNRVLEAEFRGFLPDQVLAFVDRLSMAHSLEVRCPFLDQDFVRIAAGLPGPWKIEGGVLKAVLKRAALKILPEDLVHRRKEGFLMPMTPWLAGDGRSYVRDILSPATLRRQGLFRAEGVERLLERFYSGDSQLGTRVLTLVAFQVWHETYLCG